MENITKFFHNILPGSYFLFFLFYIYPPSKIQFIKCNELLKYLVNNPKDSIVALTFAFLIAALLLGFISQAIIRLFIKERYLYTLVLNWVICRDQNSYKLARAILKKLLLIPNQEENNPRTEFYVMNNFLIANNKNLLLDNFSVGSALWGNLAIASVILFVTNMISSPSNITLQLIFFLIFLLGTIMFFVHLNTTNSIILKSFVSEIQINHKDIRITNMKNGPPISRKRKKKK